MLHHVHVLGDVFKWLREQAIQKPRVPKTISSYGLKHVLSKTRKRLSLFTSCLIFSDILQGLHHLHPGGPSLIARHYHLVVVNVDNVPVPVLV